MLFGVAGDGGTVTGDMGDMGCGVCVLRFAALIISW